MKRGQFTTRLWWLIFLFLILLVFYFWLSSQSSASFRNQLASLTDPVDVKDDVPPTVTLTSPSAGATVSNTITVSADASDNVGVTGVDFFQNSALISSVTTAPYSVSWNTTTVPNGPYSLTAQASDAANNQATSAAVPVTVNNIISPPANSSTDPNHLADGSHILFVDKNNSSCSDSGARAAALNPATPWCGPTGLDEQAARKFQPGDTVYLKAGDYTTAPLHLASAGASGQPIMLKPYPGDSVTIRGQSGSSEALITMWSGANYWSFDGLNFISTTQAEVVDANFISGLTLRNSQFSLGPQNNAAVIRLSGVTGTLVDGVTITCLNDISLRQVDAMTSDGFNLNSSNNNTVRNSHFGDCGHVSFNLANSSNNLVEKNVIENRLHTGLSIVASSPGSASGNIIRQNIIRNYNQYPVWSNLPGIGLEILHASGNLVYNNLIYGGANGATGIGIGADSSRGQSNDNKIYNNTIYQPGGRGIELANFGSADAISGNKVDNNIITGVGAPASGPNQDSRNAPIATTFDFANNGHGNEIKNNLLNAADGVVLKSRGAGAALLAAYTVATLTSVSFASGNVGGEPLFASAGSDFSLQATSPGIDAGQCLPEVSTDYNGRARPTGVGCDIGAFESGLANQVTPPTLIVSPPPVVPPVVPPPVASTTSPIKPLLLLLPKLIKPAPILPKPKPTPLKPPAGGGVVPGPTEESSGKNLAGCNERWFCHLDWSECQNGVQTRDCTELSKCGTTTHRPPTTQACVAPSETYASPVSQPISSNTAWDLSLPNLNLTEEQTKALAILVPTFLATLAALITILLRLWL